jgi:hypothetical protein
MSGGLYALYSRRNQATPFKKDIYNGLQQEFAARNV